MAQLTSIDIDCWICGTTFYVPARLSMLPPGVVHGPWYGKQMTANVWAYVETTEINNHVREHWPILVTLFLAWRAFIDVVGFDPLEHYRGRA